jgi:glucose-6-phosphate 1-dehydrogenase
MTTSRSDALVFFGATGDLAHKMTFPELYAMAKRVSLKVPLQQLQPWKYEQPNVEFSLALSPHAVAAITIGFAQADGKGS